MGQPSQTYGVVFNINYSAQLTTILPAATDAIDEVGPVGSSLACTFCVVRTFGMLLNAGGGGPVVGARLPLEPNKITKPSAARANSHCITHGRYVGYLVSHRGGGEDRSLNFCKPGLSIQMFPVMPVRHHRRARRAGVSVLPSLAENPAQQAECAEEDHNRGDDGEHQEGDEEGAASAAALLDEYLCRRLLRRWLSHSGAFSLRWV